MLKRFGLLVLFLGSFSILNAQNFSVGKYGGDFLTVGGGARALAMGSAFTSITNDVTSIYWNPAGLTQISKLELLYMHSERFNGIVGYDFGAIAMPLKQTNGVVGVGIIRQGVDGIPNTLNAWDNANNQPLPNPSDRITKFSAFDLAFFVSYAQPISNVNSWGVNFKVINSKIGPFAQAWGYSLDVALQERGKNYAWGVMIQDVTTLFKFWQTNKQALSKLEDFNDIIPNGRNEKILPTIKLGYGRFFQFGEPFKLTLSADTDVRFENLQTYYMNWGKMSFEPHLGIEFGYINMIFLRSGLTDFFVDDKGKNTFAPTFGIGLSFSKIEIDYGMGSLMGTSADLGSTHRISLKLKLNPF